MLPIADAHLVGFVSAYAEKRRTAAAMQADPGDEATWGAYTDAQVAFLRAAERLAKEVITAAVLEDPEVAAILEGEFTMLGG